MSESRKISLMEGENGLFACAFGVMMLFIALTCAIAIGTSVLIPDSNVQASILLGGGLFLILSALAGGYFVSRGLIFILRER